MGQGNGHSSRRWCRRQNGAQHSNHQDKKLLCHILECITGFTAKSLNPPFDKSLDCACGLARIE
jgi:hypothetical protein